MDSRSNLPFTLLPLLAAVVLISPFMFRVIAAPTCSLISNQAREDLSSNAGATPSARNATFEPVIATGWYPGWVGNFPPSQISWHKYTALTFAFATTTPNPSVIALDSASTKSLPLFVDEAHRNSVQPLISIGGWTGSRYFSTAVSNDKNRKAFVKAVVEFVLKYNLSGVDFDWEYPVKGGMSCNVRSSSDSANFLSFLKALRNDTIGSKLVVTAAVGLVPFAGNDETPMADVSQFASRLDHIAIMDYDVWGSFSSTVGPNAPLDDSCSPTKAGSASSAVKAWTSAGFPASKIILGIAAYGHSFFVSKASATDSSGKLVAYPQFDKEKQPAGDSDVDSSTPTKDECGDSVSGNSGIFTFKGMIAKGFLNATGSPTKGKKYRFDNCSQTPFVYDPNTQTMISYDNKRSFAAKGNFINHNGLAGFALWEVTGDSNDILISAISHAMGISQVCM